MRLFIRREPVCVGTVINVVILLHVIMYVAMVMSTNECINLCVIEDR